MDSKQRAERLIEDFFLTEGQIDVEVIGERDRKELIQKIAVALEQERRQTSAEVLAACIKHFEKEAGECADFANKEAGESRAAWNRQEAWYEDCADAIRKLQPAAKALEELLEEARREARLEARIDEHGKRCVQCTKGYGQDGWFKKCPDRVSLEKARAEGKG